jgi:hypothetical protein
MIKKGKLKKKPKLLIKIQKGISWLTSKYNYQLVG